LQLTGNLSIISTYNGSHAIINCLRYCTYDGFIAGLSLKDNSKVRKMRLTCTPKAIELSARPLGDSGSCDSQGLEQPLKQLLRAFAVHWTAKPVLLRAFALLDKKTFQTFGA
jgi:hypothetical protein